MKRTIIIGTWVLVVVSTAARAGEPIDLQVITRIKAEGIGNSQVMQTLSDITDRHGPRLSGSPQMKKAAEWCRDKLDEWGMANARLESWGKFGRGWVLDRFSLEMNEPYYLHLIAHPRAWTPATDGVISGEPVVVEADSLEQLEEKYKGKLKGAIVMTPLTRQAETGFEPDAKRYTESELEGLFKTRLPGQAGGRGRFRGRRSGRLGRGDMKKFLREQGVAAVLEASRGEHGTLFVTGTRAWRPDAEPELPTLVTAVEHYGQILRLLQKKVPVKLRLNVKARFIDNVTEYNVIAEIPGTDPELRDEVVMLGGHLDAWHAATGATDNASGCGVAMEAMRILKAIGIKPRRTIRIALWTGEEQGLLGSRAYVKKHFADRETMKLTDEHARFAGYFNLDNGTGRIRGIYTQGNEAVRPIFEAYLEPFHDLDATTVTSRNTGGTDHLSFNAVGLPGFQFIQDPVDYSSRTHHTNMDTYERLQRADMIQASVIMASFVYHTAMRDEKLPRKPLPEPREPQ